MFEFLGRVEIYLMGGFMRHGDHGGGWCLGDGVMGEECALGADVWCGEDVYPWGEDVTTHKKQLTHVRCISVWHHGCLYAYLLLFGSAFVSRHGLGTSQL